MNLKAILTGLLALSVPSVLLAFVTTVKTGILVGISLFISLVLCLGVFSGLAYIERETF